MSATGAREIGFFEPKMARIVESAQLTHTERFLRLELESGEPLGHLPGQFVQVSMFGIGEAPISLCSSPTRPEYFDLCVRAAGNVTEAMQKLGPGEWLGIRGPFGDGFFLDEMQNRDVLLICGGIGIAPLRSLIQYVLDNRELYQDVIVVYGARCPPELLFQEDLAEWSRRDDVELHMTVEEPTQDWKMCTGVVTVPLADIEITPQADLTATVCGPPVMYRFVAQDLLERDVSPHDIFFSLERQFKCGIGKCGHCQLDDLYVCQDGPVFRYSELMDKSEAVEVWNPEEESGQ